MVASSRPSLGPLWKLRSKGSILGSQAWTTFSKAASPKAPESSSREVRAAGRQYAGQYLYKGATKFGEPGVYVSTEEPPSEFKANMLRFGWDFKKLENEKKIGMVDAVYQRVESEVTEQESLQSILYNLRSQLSEVKIIVEQLGATRLVVDSLPGFGFRVTDLNTLREIFLEIGLLLKDVGCTTLMTTEIVEG